MTYTDRLRELTTAFRASRNTQERERLVKAIAALVREQHANPTGVTLESVVRNIAVLRGHAEPTDRDDILKALGRIAGESE